MITFFLIFIIESSIFIFYNFYNKNFSHGFFILSLIFSIFYLLIILFFLFLLFFITKKILVKNERNEKFWFIWKGIEIKKKNLGKYFQSIQYLFYFIFSIIIVFFYNFRKIQIILNFIFLIIFFLYIIFFLPPNSKFWKFEQIGIHGFLIITKILLLILILDFENNNISENNKNNLGYTISIFIFFIIFWNFMVLLIKLILRLKNCYFAKKKKNNFKFSKNLKKIENNEEDQKLVNSDKKENFNIFDFEKNEEYPKMSKNENIVEIIKPDLGEEDFYDDILKNPKKIENLKFEEEKKI